MGYLMTEMRVTGQFDTEANSVSRHLKLSLVGLLIVAVMASLALVAISYALYLRSPEHKFDLARPGNPNNNAVVGIEPDDDNTDVLVDVQAAKQKLESLDKELKALSGFGSYSSQDVSDQALGLQPNDTLAQ